MPASPFFPAKAVQSRWTAVLLWSLMAIGFGSTGWAFGVKPIAVMIQNWRLAQEYREVDAKIVSNNLRALDGNMNFLVAVMYEVDGKPYYTERLTLVDDAARDEPENTSFAMSLRALANTDAKTKVWVDPKDPRQAVVLRFITEQAIVRRASLAIAFTLLSLVGALAAVGALGNFRYYRRFEKSGRSWVITSIICAVVFPLRRLFIDADVDQSDDFLEIAIFLECVAGLFILVAIKLLFERVPDNIRTPGNESASAPPALARGKRRKKS